MSKEKQPNLSAEYGTGMGRVDFKTSQFSSSALREIARLQISSVDSPFIMLTHPGGRTTTVVNEELKKGKALRGKALKTFTTELGKKMATAETVSIIRAVERAPYHPSSEIKHFIQGIDSIDEF